MYPVISKDLCFKVFFWFDYLILLIDFTIIMYISSPSEMYISLCK